MPSQTALGVKTGAWTVAGAVTALGGVSGCFAAGLGSGAMAAGFDLVSGALAGLKAFNAASAARALSVAMVFEGGLDAVWMGVDATVAGMGAGDAWDNAVEEVAFC